MLSKTERERVEDIRKTTDNQWDFYEPNLKGTMMSIKSDLRFLLKLVDGKS